MKFLSTPSARRATLDLVIAAALYVISIHALREEGDFGPAFIVRVAANISIHALREEGDHGNAGENTVPGISIHALREEGDISLATSG